jgi:asparagine synthetase B (glutamine-hydrolysing)
LYLTAEIYNFLELRRELERLGQSFQGHSDTSIMLAGFSEWGVHEASNALMECLLLLCGIALREFCIWDAIA